MVKTTRKLTKKLITGKRFTLTVHGATKEDLQKLKTYFETDDVTLACVAWETGEHNIHPHWQVYFELNTEKRMKDEITTILGHSDYHLENARGTTAANVNYIFAVDKSHEVGFIHYRKNTETPKRYREADVKYWENLKLKPFQQQIIEIVNKGPDRRTIYYIWEATGNVGKTTMAEYLHIYYGAIITGGSPSDMKYAVIRWKEITKHYPPIIIVDVARNDRIERTSYKALETIKNGLFFSGKYESGMTHSVAKPIVLIFANVPPDISQFSSDRWKIFKIRKNKLYPDNTSMDDWIADCWSIEEEIEKESKEN